MTADAPDAAQWARWQAAVQQPPQRPRQPLWLGGAQVGSVEPGLIQRLALAQPQAWMRWFEKVELKNELGWALKPNLTKNFTPHLTELAHALHACGGSGAWRNELLPVLDEGGHELAQVERAVVRVLGMRTRAVHLVGWCAPADATNAALTHSWLQLRAHTKPNDPGLWDTLMGGTVAAGESVVDTLVRETWEEAGLRLNELAGLTHGGRFTATRPVPDGEGSGYLVEDTDWYTVQVPAHLTPVNQDGEVDHFEAWTLSAVWRSLQNGGFTAEARWVLAQALRRNSSPRSFCPCA